MPQRKTPKKPGRVGARIIEGLKQALAWSKSEPSSARVSLVRIPDIDIRELRRGTGLRQS